MRSYFLGIDVGGSKTHALVTDESGQTMGFGESGPGNHEVVGYGGLGSALQEATHKALEIAKIKVEQIAGAGFGVAGYDWPSELEPTLESIHNLGLACPLEVVNDTVVGLLAGASQGWGVAVVAGTSNNCRGRDRNGREGRVTGNGMMFGEYGGGVELVMKAIHAVNYAWIQRGPATRLTQVFLDLTGAKDAADFIEGLVNLRYQPDAAWALAIFQSAYNNDPVAQEAIAWAGRELGELAVAVIHQLNLENEEFEVVQVGSLYDGGPLLTKPMRETIQAVAARARMVRLTAPPVVGGVVLGMQKAGLETHSRREKIIASAKDIFERET